LIRLARDELELPLKGLMCIPPLDDNPAPHFALLRELARAENLPWLSMGMSGDFETAIRLAPPMSESAPRSSALAGRIFRLTRRSNLSDAAVGSRP